MLRFVPFVFFVVPALAAVPMPSPVSSPTEIWAAFTKDAVSAGDFAGWRVMLAEKLCKELPPAAIEKSDTPGAALALAQWTFFRDVLAADAGALTQLGAAEGGAEFLAWLLSNRDALDEYNHTAALFRLQGKRSHGLDGWREIWYQHSESREPGLWRRVAAACAIAFAAPRPHSTPRERFEFFRSSHAAGQLVPYFETAPTFELVLTVHADGRGNDELEWAQDATPKEKKTQSAIGGYGHSLIPYRLDNYRGQSVQGPEYYDRKRNDLATVMEYGGVCGMVSHMNSTVANAHGVPAFTAGQPGHCAYVWKSNGTTWAGGNFVSGWRDTHDSHQQGFWLSGHSANINLVSAAVASPGFGKAQRLRALGGAWRAKDAERSAQILAAATSANGLDYSAWRDRIDATLAWDMAPPAAWRGMAADIAKAFPKFPIAMNDLLARFDTKKLLTDYKDAEKVAYASATARQFTSIPAGEQWELVFAAWKPWLSRQLAALGLPEKAANEIVEGKANGDTFSKIAADKRPHVEALFAGLLPAVESNSTLFKESAAEWLALVAGDAAANARAARFFQAKLAAADGLREIEMLAEPMLTATRSSADARADLVAAIRKRLGAVKKPDPGRMDALLAVLAKHNFRDAGKIGAWTGAQFAKGGEQSLEWDITPMLAKAESDYALNLNFRWTAGAPLGLKSVRLFEGGTELNADNGAETADATLRPAVATVRLPKPKAGVKYTVRATATGGADSTGVVLAHAQALATFRPDEWAVIGGWGGKEISAAPVITEGWHEMEFDATQHLREPGPVFVMFKYNSYSSPRVMNVRLFADGREVAADLHSCNPISGANTMYSLRLPPGLKTNAKITVRALFTPADGWGTVYVKKLGGEKKTATRTLKSSA